MTITFSGDLSALAAWYAAIVITLALVVQVLQYLINERVRVKIMYGINFVSLGAPDQKLVRIDILNKGKRPVTITTLSCFAKTKGRVYVLPYPPKPIELFEGKSETYYFPQDDSFLDKIDCFVVNDMVGGVFKIKYRNDHRDKEIHGMRS